MLNAYVQLLRLRSLTALRPILDLPGMQALQTLLSELSQRKPAALTLLDSYGALLSAIRSEDCSLGAYLARHLALEPTPLGEAVAAGTEDEALLNAGARDLAILNEVALLDSTALLTAMSAFTQGIEAGMLGWTAEPLPTMDALLDSWRCNGVGQFAVGQAFRYDRGELQQVRKADPIRQVDMTGYEWQRQQVLQNTRALVNGQRANNVLLYGDSGTGKSALIKSLIHEPDFARLRLIEVDKASFGALPALLRLCGSQSQVFIVFLDDISFEPEDPAYGALKSALEGGLEPCAPNVRIYATSNRRHMVKELHSDRSGDQLHIRETIQEQTSLAERFGLKLPYLAMSKPEYLAMVHFMAEREGIEDPQMDAKANQWELEHAGRTPRVARQFVDALHAGTV